MYISPRYRHGEFPHRFRGTPFGPTGHSFLCRFRPRCASLLGYVRNMCGHSRNDHQRNECTVGISPLADKISLESNPDNSGSLRVTRPYPETNAMATPQKLPSKYKQVYVYMCAVHGCMYRYVHARLQECTHAFVHVSIFCNAYD